MRRSPALALTTAIAAAAVTASTFSAASAEPPGDTEVTGNFYVTPDPPSVGQTVKLTANFPSGNYDVTFYEKTGSEPETWTSIGTDPSNDQGNAYLYTHEVDGNEELYARITSGGEGRTAVKTVTPIPADVILPNGPDVGNLHQTPLTYAEGDLIKLTANFPSGTFPITVYKETGPNEWTEIATKQSNSQGNAYFYDFEVVGSQKLFARKANNDRTEVDVVAPTPEVTLNIRRDCTGNDCSANTATVTGELNPAQAGRTFQLQRFGTTWSSIGDPEDTDADGTVQFQISLDGLSQWTALKYRLHSAADESNPAATSHEVSFMPGPTALGTNVLRVDVEDGVFPTSKSTEHEGEATLSVNGEVKLDDVKLENFGVRGTSTASYRKKPYKLKFDKSPKDTGVFGMPADKSWTLLAMYLDQAFVRDKTGLELGRRMTNIAWTPDSRYVELFVNDQYRGAYLMTESVKIDGDRVDVDPLTGMIMEVDGVSVEDPKLGFLSKIGKIAFAFKDPDEIKSGAEFEEGVTPTKLTSIKNRVNNLESRLYSSSRRTGPDGWQRFIDTGSAVDYYLVKEFTKDNDADFYRSHYFSWNPTDVGAKFHFGPAWDFDRSAGVHTDTDAAHLYQRSPQGWYLRGTGTSSGRTNYKTHWYVQLFKDPVFKNAVKARWEEIKGEFKKAGDEDVAAYVAALGVGAQNDRARWEDEPKRFIPRGSYAAEVDHVTSWYKARWKWIDDNM